MVSLGFCLPWNCSGRRKVCFYWGVAPGHSLGCSCSLQRGDTWLSSASWNTGWVVSPQESEAAPCSFQLCWGHEALEYRQWPVFERHVSDQRKENLLLLVKLLELLFSMKRWGKQLVGLLSNTNNGKSVQSNFDSKKKEKSLVKRAVFHFMHTLPTSGKVLYK